LSARIAIESGPGVSTRRGSSRAVRQPRAARGIEVRRARWRWHADLLDQLRDVPCSDCGGRFPPCAMDFDHRDSTSKVQGVTRMIARASIERILAEVDKCDIVCANCHRVRTFRRRSPTVTDRDQAGPQTTTIRG
jgi:hypothetical protein